MTAGEGEASGLDPADLFQAHPVATFLIGRDGTIRFANSAAEQLCNLSRAALIGRPLHEILSLDAAHAARFFAANDSAFLAHAAEVRLGRRDVLRADLQRVPLHRGPEQLVTVAPLHREAELIGGVSGRPAQTAGAAAAMLAHEIKNPLAGIRGAAQLLARDHGAKAHRFTDLICAEVDRIAKLIDQMEHFSRGQPIACTSVNPYPALRQAVELARAQPGVRARLVEEYDPSIPHIHGNHDALVQIILNLLRNAQDAVQDGDEPQIRLTTAYRHGLSIDRGEGQGRIPLPIEVMVSDNGPGVPAAIRDALFDPFVTTKRDGRGLGLALVAKLVRDMGGAVQHMAGEGWTHFRLHLPAAPGERDRT